MGEEDTILFARGDTGTGNRGHCGGGGLRKLQHWRQDRWLLVRRSWSSSSSGGTSTKAVECYSATLVPVQMIKLYLCGTSAELGLNCFYAEQNTLDSCWVYGCWQLCACFIIPSTSILYLQFSSGIFLAISKHNVFSNNEISLDRIIKPHLRVKYWMMNALQSTSNGAFSGWSETHFAQCSLGWRRCCL